MKLDDIQNEWGTDCKINPLNISDESLNISVLHNKYWKILSYERQIYKKLESDLKTLRHEKHEFLFEGPTKETQEKGWKLPPIGKIMKADIPRYLDADSDIINLTLRLGMQLEKVQYLEDIIKSIHNRGFQIKSYIDYERFKAGLN